MTSQLKSFKKYIILFWTIVIGGILSVFLIFWLVASGFFGELPTFEELENPKNNLASVIYSADGKILGTYFKENRINIDYDELSPYLVNGLVATEDERYYNHSGIDLKGTLRAVAFLGTKGGASTITQQLAKMLFHERSTSTFGRIIQKLQEWIIAVQLERQYTKEEIIAMYFNRLDFVNNAVGIKSAANVYFGKEPKDLKIEEAAVLVGMAKNPSLFNPVRRPDTTLHRRNVVLYQMMRNQFITKQEFDSLKQLPLELHFQKVDHKEGLAPYFREVLRAELKKILLAKDSATGEYLIKKPNGKPYDIYKDGLRIYTTIDSRMQKYAEWAVKEHLSKDLQPAFFRDIARKGKKAPFDWRVSNKEIEKILKAAMKRTQRYRILTGQECANCGRRGKYVQKEEINGQTYYVCQAEDCGFKKRAVPKDSIEIIFNTPVKMRVFTWKGEVDTVMSPMDSIRYYKSYLQAGLMSMDPHTGFIKAWVGGIDYKHFKYDHVKQGKRQVGSTFKPFVYTLAIQEGYSPCYEVPNVPVVFEKEKWGMEEDWSPKNSDEEYGGMVSLKYGIANSMNTVTAWVLKQFGPNAPQQVINLARKMGITSHLDPVPSICLGVSDISLYEMVGAFATFANKGIWIEPIFLTRIEDKDGNVIKDFVPQVREVMNEETAYVMLDLLKGVTQGAYNRHTGKTIGTGIRIRYQTERRPYGGIKYPVAGKTGTTQNNSDGWFIGITPDLVTGVWVGAEDRSVRFSRTSLGQGANMALPIWAYYMKKVYEDPELNISKGDFEKPEVIHIELDCEKYYRSQSSDFSGNDDIEMDFEK
jgi:penicillin-binding protein 1A